MGPTGLLLARTTGFWLQDFLAKILSGSQPSAPPQSRGDPFHKMSLPHGYQSRFKQNRAFEEPFQECSTYELLEPFGFRDSVRTGELLFVAHHAADLRLIHHWTEASLCPRMTKQLLMSRLSTSMHTCARQRGHEPFSRKDFGASAHEEPMWSYNNGELFIVTDLCVTSHAVLCRYKP